MDESIIEQQLKEINETLKSNTKKLSKFGKSLFRISKFIERAERESKEKEITKTAAESASQGASVEEPVKATESYNQCSCADKTPSITESALILTQVTGLDIKDSVESITAAIDSFNEKTDQTLDIQNEEKI